MNASRPRDRASLTKPVLAEVLGTRAELILSRVELEDWRKPGRRVERVTWVSGPDGESRAACVKYGVDLEHEALAYVVLLDAARDRVPHLIGYRASSDGTSVLAMEWLDGRTPDFRNVDDTVSVFNGAGRFAGEWAATVRSSSPDGLARNPVPASLKETWVSFLGGARNAGWYAKQLDDDAASVLERSSLLASTDIADAVAACRKIRTLVSRLAASICSVPLTLDPGDFADENALLAPDGSPYLLDFDNVRLAPAVQMLESVGEDWSSQPPPGLIVPALRAFVDGWMAVQSVPLDWHRFLAAHRSLRVWRKCYELEYSLRDLAGSVACSGEYADDSAAFARACARDLPALLRAAVQTLPPATLIG